MKHVIARLSVILMTCCICISAFAGKNANENHTLHVYITNETDDSLHFERIDGSNPGNEFTVTPDEINPGQHGIITVENLADNDIGGKVIFTNSAGIEASLFILVQRQIHIGQPVFNLSGIKHHSIIVSKTRNKNIGPRYLTYVEAVLRVLNKNSG